MTLTAARSRLASRLTVERVATLDALIALRSVWTDLLARAGSGDLFASHEWAVEWWRHFGEGRQMWVLLVRDGADALAVAPMMVGRTRYGGMPVRMLSFFENKHVSRSSVVLAERRSEIIASLVRFWCEHAAEWDTLRLAGVPQSSGVSAPTVAALRQAGLAVYGPDEDNRLYYIDTTGPIENYWSGRPRKFRKNINEARNHLARARSFEYRIVEDKDRLPAAIHEMFRLDQVSRKQNSPTAIYNATEKAFCSALAQSLSLSQRCAVHFLLVEGQPIASLLTPVYDGTIFFQTTYFDERYEHLDPGRNLIWRVIEWSWRTPGIKRIDFNGNSSFVQRWTSECEVLERLSACHHRPYSLLIGALKSTKRIAARHRTLQSRRRRNRPTIVSKMHESAMADPIEVDVLRGIGQLDGLAEEWRALADGSDIFSDYDWVRIWTSCFAREEEVVVVRATQNGQAVAFLPLVLQRARWRGLPVRALRLCTNEHSPVASAAVVGGDPHRVVAAMSQAVRAMGSWDLFDLPALRIENETNAHLMLRMLVECTGSVYRLDYPFVLDLPQDWEAYRRGLTANFRRNLKRTERKLAGWGPIAVDVFGDSGSIDRGFAALLRVDAESWKHSHGQTIESNPLACRYYKALASTYAARGRAWITIISAGGSALAAVLAFAHNGTGYGLKISAAAAAESGTVSPGHYAVMQVLQEAARRRLRRFHFLSGAPSWERYGGAPDPVGSARCYGRAAYGAIIAAVEECAASLEALRHRLRRSAPHRTAIAQPAARTAAIEELSRMRRRQACHYAAR